MKTDSNETNEQRNSEAKLKEFRSECVECERNMM